MYILKINNPLLSIQTKSAPRHFLKLKVTRREMQRHPTHRMTFECACHLLKTKNVPRWKTDQFCSDIISACVCVEVCLKDV
jgi:hypothetical protein